MKSGNSIAVYTRTLDLPSLISRKSLFLLGPRQTGKTTLLETLFPDATLIQLLDPATYRQLLSHPERLMERLPAIPGLVVIDEVQRCPSLLDVVQATLGRHPNWRFLLTGSSARKLRKLGVNLLGGRAGLRHLHPITSAEVATDREADKSIKDLIAIGGLPPVLRSDAAAAELQDYVDLYLREEIQMESAVRNLPGFSRFLQVAGAVNGEQLVFTNVARDAEVPARTVREYFFLLQDTLLGELVPGFAKTSKRKAMTSAKFYFFDVGVANALAGRVGVSQGDEAWGRAMEHFVYTELRAWKSYRAPDAQISYWRSTSQLEVDFVVEWQGRLLGIECKATRSVGASDMRGLRALQQEHPSLEMIVVCNEPALRRVDGVRVLPLATFCQFLWQDSLHALNA